MPRNTVVSQVTLERIFKACARAGIEKARVHINVSAQTIDVMIGEEGPSTVGSAFDRWRAEKERQERR